ncbi:MAG: exodeoxyribonuclease VII large subunit [Fusobacteriaceae bacterium]
MDKIYSVTEFNKMLKRNIEDNPIFSDFFLKGELSSVSYYKSGHLYFNLKDKDAQIKCAAFNYKMKRIPEDLKEGDEVKIFCDAGVYENRGELQILVRNIEKKNKMGALFLALEKLKKELETEGYFLLKHKKKLPKYPKNIGVVTAYTGAAVQDIIKTIRKRDDRINIYIYPAKVQGIGAKEEIVAGIKALNKIEELDFIIAGRGGGSIEDLWCFNEKEVAMEFFHSKKPIISAVGHESDNLLSDLTADVRAATPTQAVELSVPEKIILLKDLEERKKRIIRVINVIMNNSIKELEKLKDSYYLKNFPKEINRLNQEIVNNEKKIYEQITKIIKFKENLLQVRTERIIGLNPMKILSNGYSITTFNENSLKNIENLKLGDLIETKLKTGKIKSIIKELVKDV